MDRQDRLTPPWRPGATGRCARWCSPGEQANLLDLPQIVHCGDDAGAYFSSGVILVRDPGHGHLQRRASTGPRSWGQRKVRVYPSRRHATCATSTTGPRRRARRSRWPGCWAITRRSCWPPSTGARWTSTSSTWPAGCSASRSGWCRRRPWRWTSRRRGDRRGRADPAPPPRAGRALRGVHLDAGARGDEPGGRDHGDHAPARRRSCWTSSPPTPSTTCWACSRARRCSASG